MLYQWGLLMYRWRWAVVIIWGLAVISALPLGSRANSVLSNGFGLSDTEAQRGAEILETDLGLSGSSVTVVFYSGEFSYLDFEFENEVTILLDRLQSLNSAVTMVVTPYGSKNENMVSEDGATVYATIYLDSSMDETMEMLPDLREPLKSSVLEVKVTGGIPIFYDLNVISENDLRRAETVALPVILVVLVFVFGSLVAAVLPLVMGLMSILFTAALIYLLAQTMDMSVFVLNIATLLGLGVAIDYSLLVVNRFREELETKEVVYALGTTVATSGKAILFSALTSIIGLSGLLLFDFMMLRSIGVGGVVVMFLSLCIAMTLLPAAIGILGQRVNSLKLFRLRKSNGSFWNKLASHVMKRPFSVAIPVVILLLFLGIPFLNVKLGAPWASILPSDAASRQGMELINRGMGPGETSPIIVVYKSPKELLTPDNIAAIHGLGQELVLHDAVDRVESIVTIDPSISLEEYQFLYSNINGITDQRIKQILEDMVGDQVTFMRVFSRYDIMADETQKLVEGIRSSFGDGDMVKYVTGGTADLMDSIEVMYGVFPKVVLFVLVTIYVVLFLLFRSLILPLKAVLMNGMSIFATYGAIVFIFQDGHFQNLLGFTEMGYTDAIMPIVLFCIIFGISMDYEVFLLSRVKEIYDETGDNVGSVSMGLERTGRIITSAALVMILVCASFALADIVVVKMFGVGLGLAILLDATLVRALLVPALMRIMGRLNWWAPRILGGRPTV